MGVIQDAAMLGGGPPTFADSIGAPDIANANAVGQEASDTLSSVGALQRANQPPAFYEVKHTTSSDGQQKVSATMPIQTFDTLTQLMQTGQATINAFGAARAQLAAKQEFLQKNPIVAGLGAIASSAAAQYAGGPGQAGRIAPLVRAAGAYGLGTFGQTPEALQQEQAGLTEKQFDIAARIQNQQNITERTNIEKNAQNIQLLREQNNDLEKVNDNYRSIAQRGAITPAIVDNYKKEYMAKGGTASAADAGAKNLVDENTSVLANKNLVRSELIQNGHKFEVWSDPTTGDVKRKTDLGVADLTPAQELAKQKRTEDDQVVETAAQGMIAKDPGMIFNANDVISKRGDLLGRAYARAKQLDPTFNPSATVRKLQTIKDFTNGKQADQIQSFGTFLEHANDALGALRDIQNTSTPAYNTVRNKLSKEVAGDPTVTRALAALDPVRDEFKTFLLNNRAMYESDRKDADTILDINASPAQVEAALREMAKVVDARYNELDNRFKTSIGTGLTESGFYRFTPEAQTAAATLGARHVATPDVKAQTAPAPIIEKSPSTGQIRRSLDGGKTYQYSQDGGKTFQ